MGHWYSRPVLFVSDIEKALDFYVGKFGFSKAWGNVEEGKLFVAQVDRSGCELILSSQWPEKNGSGLIFLSLDPADVSVVRGEFLEAGVDVKSGWWGYPLMIVEDPDGNELYIPCNTEECTKSGCVAPEAA